MGFGDIQTFLDDYCIRNYYPGAAAGIFYNNEPRYFCTGRLFPEANSFPVSPETIFDLASLTKPVATATAILQLVEKGLLKLSDNISLHMNEFRLFADKSNITIQNLLTHSSGLPAWKPLYLQGNTNSQIFNYIASCSLDYPTNSKIVYSCLGYIILAEVLRRLTQLTLGQYCQAHIFKPLQMHNTFFNPDSNLSDQIAPTEMGNEYERFLAGNTGQYFSGWRRYRLHGEVQDFNAWTLNGEGGNAGLFSSIADLMTFSRCILSKGTYGTTQILTENSVKNATSIKTYGLDSNRGLGWLFANSSQSAGNCFSMKAFGHNGFSGTSLWIDPDLSLIVILLTNRSFYGGNGNSFGKIRAPFHNLVVNKVLNLLK